MQKDKKINILIPYFMYSQENINEIKEWIAEVQECEVNDVTDDDLYNYIESDISLSYDDFKSNIESLLSENYGLMRGTCQRWNGTSKGGKFIKSINDLLNTLSSYDDIYIYDMNGHLYFECYHHDGTDSFEFKLLTAKGKEYAANHNFEHNESLHNVVFTTNLYSKLPHYIKTFY